MWVTRVRLELLPVNGSIIWDKAATTTVQFKFGKNAFHFAKADKADVLRWTSTSPVTSPLAGWKTMASKSGEPHTAEYWLEKPMR
jgi:hypothetical protein